MRTSTLFAALFLGSTAFAGTRYVDSSLATGLNDGSSWANAYRGPDALATALTAAVASDELWVKAGTYIPNTSLTRTIPFALKSGVAVYGGFNGTETLLSQRDHVLNVTVLSADLAGNDGGGTISDNTFHVVTGAGTNASAVLDGFTVRGGNANGASAQNNDKGGGILCLSGASPTIRNCLFTANRCTFGGGAGYINASAPTFTDCVFDANLGGSFGGAFDMASGVTAKFDRCVFSNNSAARAGGIEIFGSSTVHVYNSLFFANTSTGSGGGAMYISGSSPLIRNCTIVANNATNNAAAGILSSGASASITNCVVYLNVGMGGASGASSQISPTTLTGVTYTLTSTGHAGTGNVTATPLFDSCGPFPYRLTSSSPGVDAGSNAGVVAGVTLDLAHAARFQDVPSVADTGSGSAPLVDMGAFESDPDCNANNISDWCDIDGGTSLDANANGIPDECECQGGTPPFTYCTAKLNSQFCLPAIDFNGYASASNSVAFTITASNILNQKTGLLFYGYQSNAVPFLGGTLCVAQPIKRTATINSGGSVSGTDCTGTFSFDFNALIASGVDPQIQVVGQQVNAQFWSRDPQDPFTTNTTDAVQFNVCQ